MLVIWSHRALKSSFNALRLLASRLESDAARAFAFICNSRSDTDCPADRATSMMLEPRDRESLTEFNDSDVALCDCAIAQVAPSSLADDTLRPVLIRL